jgi:putative membrane protein
MMGYGGFGLGWMVVMGVFVSLVIVGLVLLGIGLLRSPSASASGSRDPDALEVLRLRFARGEITEEEYQTRRRHLEETSKRGENMG